MKSVDWGTLYASHRDASLVPKEVEAEVLRLFDDEDVTKQAGIYPYVLTRDERHLNLRSFPQSREAACLQYAEREVRPLWRCV